MKNSYARHKRFLSDVIRAIDSDMVSNIVSQFIPLRSSPTLEFLSDEEIYYITSKMVNTDVIEVYRTLSKDGLGLTNHELIFRMKRVKYIKSNDDSFTFNITPMISELGQTFMNNITIPNIEVRKMVEMKKEVKEEVKKEKKDMKEAMDWILENVSWTGRNGQKNEGKMSAQEASSEINLSALKIRSMLRDYYKDKPLPKKDKEVEDKEVNLEDFTKK